jgi:hypothetical protein
MYFRLPPAATRPLLLLQDLAAGQSLQIVVALAVEARGARQACHQSGVGDLRFRRPIPGLLQVKRIVVGPAP